MSQPAPFRMVTGPAPPPAVAPATPVQVVYHACPECWDGRLANCWTDDSGEARFDCTDCVGDGGFEDRIARGDDGVWYAVRRPSKWRQWRNDHGWRVATFPSEAAALAYAPDYDADLDATHPDHVAIMAVCGVVGQ